MRPTVALLLALAMPAADADALISADKARRCAMEAAAVQSMMIKVQDYNTLSAWLNSSDAGRGADLLQALAALVWANRYDPNFAMRHYDECVSRP